jgi:hypothetical protein
MVKLLINNRLARKMKKMGFFGDYILAKRLQPSFRYSIFETTKLPLRGFIDSTLRWVDTPQGSKFWADIYRAIIPDNLNI